MFGQSTPSAASDGPEARTPRVAIVGSGFSGLGLGIALRRAGIHSFTIYEKAHAIGGTWRDNHYPGAACDVQSHLYSFSFEPNPHWSRMFASHDEIRAYLERCTDKYQLREHIQLRTEISSARFDAERGVWTLTFADGQTAQADILCSAAGALSRPAKPEIPGIERFAGKLFHSANWDHDYVLEGKTVGVIGTGASAIQFVPQIAPRVRQLHLFQRTPPWVIAKPDRQVGPMMQSLYARAPLLQKLHRGLIYSALELRVIGFVVDKRLMRLPQLAAERFLKQQVPDPALRAKLTPNYMFGCKRVLLSNDYYAALVRDNVEVVDTGIAEVTADGVITKDGVHRKLDALILGTGFSAAESVAPFPITGLHGVDLNDHWRDGAEAYLGTTVSGYPNFFMFFGPNSALGHSSMVYIIEAQIEHCMRALAALQQRRARYLDLKDSVLRAFNDELQVRLRQSVWAEGCTSWYKSKTGKNTMLWPDFTFRFRKRALDFDEGCYDFAPASEHAPRPTSVSAKSPRKHATTSPS